MIDIFSRIANVFARINAVIRVYFRAKMSLTHFFPNIWFEIGDDLTRIFSLYFIKFNFLVNFLKYEIYMHKNNYYLKIEVQSFDNWVIEAILLEILQIITYSVIVIYTGRFMVFNSYIPKFD